MNRRLRASARLRSALLAATVGALFLVAPAFAAVWTNIDDWNLTETTSSAGGGTQFHISSGGSLVQYRWLDSPNKSTVISVNNCADLALLGGPQTYGVGDTGYHNLYNGAANQCFILRGRTGSGQGSMSLHDGRVNR
jgi:hypothetical protein